jgi:hypothetical protein
MRRKRSEIGKTSFMDVADGSAEKFTLSQAVSE